MDPLSKLSPALSPPKSRQICCSVKSIKRVGVLLAFHLLNILVSMGGIICVTLLLVSMVVMPAWIAAVAIVAFVITLLEWVSSIPRKCLRYCCFAVLVVLYLASFSASWHVYLAPYVCLGVGVVGISIFMASMLIVTLLVKADVNVAKLVTHTTSTEERSGLHPEDRFKMKEATDASTLLPHIRMTRRVWAAVVYFAVLKVAVGLLSAAVLICTVVLPALVVFTGGDAPIIRSHDTFRDNRIAYIALFFLMWLIGAIGFLVVPILSVKLTDIICGEWESESSQASSAMEAEVNGAIPVTPENGSITASFAELESTIPAPGPTALTVL
ncbi:unnamed protein product [Phytophthora fragariaefolia]|uniref:Unnamed protein product n=1 Tax=Phytophthora fragariaefolia TaxID=1490495 RepID=A0A9W6XJZ3_9STRA|nr:unnamed protein product [Phytophthora fragariaefolia]